MFNTLSHVCQHTKQVLVQQVALVPGTLEKVCPHSTTGRVDYFGSTVNRAARLLLAARPGQILMEAPVMDTVLQEWTGDAFSCWSAPCQDGECP